MNGNERLSLFFVIAFTIVGLMCIASIAWNVLS